MNYKLINATPTVIELKGCIIISVDEAALIDEFLETNSRNQGDVD